MATAEEDRYAKQIEKDKEMYYYSKDLNVNNSKK